ncbi:FKBP-type peptidyl-prolyl cis-trans isomerase [Cellulophaga baltica]|jgi:FKBP-type peptidyl-prolyl cis-trans isomerase|uniref:FKBP-type peptidyl-prolyl cis-trans isomerase n=1 Tax=Cellulophaga baltica TaxID=76594 RepID=UPI002494940E|nr:FKBP-type peptidyl-prolyl cis-trans isomerase [Cellulophaga baltica]
MKNSILFLCLILFLGCNEEKENIDYVAKNEADIAAYIAKNNIDATRSESGLYYRIETQGEGEQPLSNSDVTVAYKGYYLDGKVFDESDANGITFNINGVIKGWTEGIAYFNEGGSGQLFVPAHLGYGSNTYGPIPGGSVLIFDINLLKVEN